MIKVAVLVGNSSEREISLKTAEGVVIALRECNYNPVIIEIDPQLPFKLAEEKPDLAFIASHGRFGEDGTIQGFLEVMGIPYIGSGVLASALAMHKEKSKQIFKQAGIQTPEYMTLTTLSPWQESLEKSHDFIEKWGTVVVKPASQGSSIGISIVKDFRILREALDKAFRYDSELLLERFIGGKELAVGIFGDLEPYALPAVEIAPCKEFYDYEAKYVPGMSLHLMPPTLSEEVVMKAQSQALAAHIILGCRDISRVDLIVDDQEDIWLLEVNTLPGMTETSLVPDAASCLGWSYANLVNNLVCLALQRKER